MIYRDAFLSLGGTNLSAFLEGVDPSFGIEVQDDTTMGDTARTNEPGLETWTISARFKNPFTDNGPDETIWGLKGTVFAVIFKPNGSATSPSNPSYTGNGTWSSWAPVSGSVGDEAVGTLEIVAAGALTRAVA